MGRLGFHRPRTQSVTLFSVPFQQDILPGTPPGLGDLDQRSFVCQDTFAGLVTGPAISQPRPLKLTLGRGLFPMTLEPAGYLLHRRGIHPELLGNLAHSRPARRPQGLLDSLPGVLRTHAAVLMLGSLCNFCIAVTLESYSLASLRSHF